uniref:Uncharacterized protein n=1 Tax=Biomphalaria glabrata TaxID=6526 RepID=A0A2C9KAB9_BIOGL
MAKTMSIQKMQASLYLTLVLGSVAVAVYFNIDDDPDHQKRNPYDIYDYRNHSCRRPCENGAPSMTCRYYFLLELYASMSTACYGCPQNKSHCSLPQCVPADGTVRGILTANRMIPGPNIFVCKGDQVEVVVDNRMGLGEGTSIHWHGMRQHGTPHMDGTNLITQCPIHSWSTMKYNFLALDSGTHFWHSHSSMQRAEGLFGGLVVRDPKDPHRHLYDEDLYEHYIILTDWTKRMSGESYAQDFHGGHTTDIHSILVNGLGKTNNDVHLPYPEFQVQSGKRFRFRMVYNGVLNCPIFVTIDDHPMLVIASDGENFEPIEVDALMIYGGERFDFILQAKENVTEVFWIRFKGHGRCLATDVFQAAVLKYEGAQLDTPQEEATFNNTIELKAKRVLNMRGGPTQKSYDIVEMNALPDNQNNDVLTAKPDKQFYISIGASEIVDARFDPPHAPSLSRKIEADVRPFNHQLNYISSRFPPSPPLFQFDSIPKDLLCNNDTMARDCSQELCVCTHMLSYQLGDVVELILVSYKDTLVHPMHMHGHSFYVTTMKRFGRPITVKEIKELDKKGLIPRKKSRVPRKDSVPVPEEAVTIIRFKADNPGFWLFHCHIEFHAELGMFLILKEGNTHQMPSMPEDFPSCQNWKPTKDSSPGQLSDQQGGLNRTGSHYKSSPEVMFTLGVVMICIAVVSLSLMLFVSLYKRGVIPSCKPVLLKETHSYQSI